jgi:hypothetical protein
VHHLVLSPDVGPLGLEPAEFVDAARRRWGEEVGVTGRTGPEVAVELEVRQRFRVCLAPGGSSVFTDGHWEEAAEVAAWVRTLLPDDFIYRLWLVDEAFGGHALLPTGVSADQLADLWIDHAREGYPPLS